MNASQPIRILVVDDQAIIRLGIATMLKGNDSIIVAGEANDGESAIRLCGEIMPDVVLMDMLMPGIDGVVALQSIHQRYPTIRVLMMSGLADDHEVNRALQAGAVGYLSKKVTVAELVGAIHAAAAARCDAPRQNANANRPQASSKLPQLTQREKEILTLIAQGLGNLGIARQLFVKSETVKSHVGNILVKLDAASRTEAVSIAMRERIIT
jgi:NarL family two-component system response regulator LiaR